MALKLFAQMSEPRLGNILGRLFLIFGYMAFPFIAALILGGPEHYPWEPIFIMSSWASIVLKHSLILRPFGFLSFFAIFFLYLIWISLLSTLLISFNKPYLKFIILIFHGLGGFLAVSMLGAEVKIPGWPPFFSITGLVVFWVYLSLDWRLATGHKKQPIGQLNQRLGWHVPLRWRPGIQAKNF